MKKLFKAILHNDLDLVRSIIEKEGSLVNCVAKAPPKSDDGQSPLQVALKTGKFAIANFLIDNGANIDFIEQESVNEWRMPVIHDAIRACVFSSRYVGYSGVQNKKETFEKGFAILKKLVKLGADVKSIDSYGNNCLMRASLDASQLDLNQNTKELHADLKSVFDLLISAGADINESNDRRPSVAEWYKDKPVAIFFKPKTSGWLKFFRQ